MGEGDGVHAPVGLELEEQAVGAVLVQLGVERDRAARRVRADGMNVGVGELWGVQRDQVAVGPEVGLEVVDGLAVAGDAEGQLRLLAGRQLRGALQLDVVPVDRALERRCRQRDAADRARVRSGWCRGRTCARR